MRRKRQKKVPVKISDDRISELSDDILLSIISRLPFTEASATTFLSTRWRYLHTYVTRLNFPPFKPTYDTALAKTTFPLYAALIDRTLDSHRADRVEELRVNSYCINGANPHKWLLFAFTRKTQIIEINMTQHNVIHFEPTNYSLGLANLLSTQPAAAAGLKCLKELSLSMIRVTDRDLELLVSDCLALESLSIQHGRDLRHVSIVGHSNLKHLDISPIWKLESFEIRDLINLVSLKCFIRERPSCALKLENIPKLIEFSTGDYIFGILSGMLFAKMPSCVRDQLQLLHLSTRLKQFPFFCAFEFANTKYLELEVDYYSESRNLTNQIPHLIEACPSLQKLVIKLSWDPHHLKSSRERLPITMCDEYKKLKWPRIFKELPIRLSVERMPPCKVSLRKKVSSNLKELEITGYVRSQSVLGLASYLISKAAASLQRVIVVPCDSSYTNRMRAQQDFQSMTPTSVNLEIKYLI